MNRLYRVSYKTRVFEREFTDEKQTGASVYFNKTAVTATGITPVKCYKANGEVYFYCSDKSVKKIVNGAFTSTGFIGDVLPLVVPVVKNGVKTVMFVSDVTAKIGEETVSGVPYGTSCAFCAGRLFIADGKKIKFSEEFDFTDFNTGLAFGGFVQVGENDGDVLFLGETGGKLYAVCEHAAYVLSPYGEEYEFTMEKIPSFELNVAANSVFQVGDRICFLSGKELCVLMGGKIKRAGKTLSTVAITANGIAGGGNGLYLLPVSSGSNGYVYVYDTLTDKESLNPAGGFTVAGLYAVKSGDDYLYQITAEISAATIGESYSDEYDFGSCARKSVCRVETHIRGNADLVASAVVFWDR